MKEFNLLTIKQMVFKETALFVFKFHTKHLPTVFNNFFRTKQNMKCMVNTRSNSSLIPSFCRLSTTQQFFCYTGPVVWNKRSGLLRKNSQTVKEFIRKIQIYLVNGNIK